MFSVLDMLGGNCMKKQKLLALLLVFTMCVSLFPNVSLAYEDVTAPELEQLELILPHNNKLDVGEKIIFRAMITDQSDIVLGNSMVSLQSPYGKHERVFFEKTNIPDVYEATYTVKATDAGGVWTIYNMHVSDSVNNGTIYDQQYLTTLLNGVKSLSFKGSNQEDITGPQIISLQMIAPKHDVYEIGDQLTFRATIIDQSEIVGGNSFVRIDSPYGKAQYLYFEKTDVENVYEASYTIQSTDARGNWEIGIIHLSDSVYNGSFYYKEELEEFIGSSIDDLNIGYKGVKNNGFYYDAVTPIFSGTATLNGQPFTSGTTLSVSGQYTLHIVDSKGYSSTVNFEIEYDQTAPEIKLVNQIQNNSPYVTGKAESNSIITVKAGDKKLGVTTTNDNGEFKVRIDVQPTGTSITLTATDKAKNVSEPYEVKVVDAIIPELPTFNTITDNTTEVYGTGEPGATVEIINETTVFGSAVIDEQGNYKMTIPKLAAGSRIMIIITNVYGNIRLVGRKVADSTPPDIKNVTRITDKTTIITGQTEPRATVVLKVDGQQIASTNADITGNFTQEIEPLKAISELVIVVIDSSNNSSEIKVTVEDVTVPNVQKIYQVTDQSKLISGKTEAGATVTIKAGTKLIGKTIANTNGQFAINVNRIKAGTILTIQATDKAGHISKAKKVTVIDKTPPVVPTVNKITSKMKVVTGKGEKGATIYIYNGGKKIGQGKVDSKGNYKVNIKAQKKNATLKVYAQDTAKNKSKYKTVKVY